MYVLKDVCACFVCACVVCVPHLYECMCVKGCALCLCASCVCAHCALVRVCLRLGIVVILGSHCVVVFIRFVVHICINMYVCLYLCFLVFV